VIDDGQRRRFSKEEFMEAKFVVFRELTGKYRFTLVGPFGELVTTCDTYNSKKACLDGVAMVRKYAVTAKLEDKTARA
jgi:uncharacterized protein YegP (UPF0339 family)